MNGPAPPSLEEVQRVTAEVLRRPEFADVAGAGSRQPGWLERLFDWLDALGPLRIDLGGVELGARVLLYVLLAALVFFLLRLIIRQGGGLRFGRTGLSTGREAPALSASRGGQEEGLRERLQQAEGALAQGDARAAVRILCGALLALMARRGELTLQRWKTNLAYLRECPREAPTYPLLQELVSVYAAVVYAHEPCERERLERLLARLRSEEARA